MRDRAPNDLYLSLALGAYDSGDHERCVDLLKGCSPEDRSSHREQFSDAHYRVAVSLCVEDRFGSSREHFRDAMNLTDDPTLKRICQARLERINAITTGAAGGLPDWLSGYGGECADCPGKRSLYECATCQLRGVPVNAPKKMGLLALQPEITEIHCMGAYRHGRDPRRSNPFSQAIRGMKERTGERLAQALGYLLAEYLRPHLFLRGTVDIITSVPTAPSRFAKRGFKVSDTLCLTVSSRLAMPFFPVVALTRETRDLRGLGRSDRRRELHGAFTVSQPELAEGRTILIIDDVVTYGTTLREMGDTLLEAGAAGVFGAVLAHTESSF